MKKTPGEILIPDWLVSAKILPPRAAGGGLSRLSFLLIENTQFITLLEAPAGYGKTTLLNQLRLKWLEQSNTNSLWITLSPEETSRSFVEYLAFALVKSGISIPDDFFDGLAENPTLHKHLNILANMMEQAGGDWLLVLDDLETVDAEICKPIEYLISIAPHNVRFLLACRQQTSLALSQYAAQDQLLHIQAEKLAFSPQQILGLLGDQISLDQATLIQEATLGWPIAVQLLNMSLKAGETLEEALRRLGDPSEMTAQYIKEQIEGPLPVELRTRLQQASILDWLETDALEAIQGKDHLLNHMSDLGEVSALISPIGEDLQTYRIHPLLREYLREALRRENPEQFKMLHKEAAIWMGKQNRFRHALSHASQACDENLIGVLIEQFGAVRLFIQEGVTRAYSSHVYLNNKILQRFPRVALMHSVIQTKRGYLKEARTIYEKISEQTKGFTEDRPGGNDAILQLDHRFCLPFLVLYGTLPSSFLKQSDLEQMPEGMGDSPLVDGAYNNTLCVSNFIMGDMKEASRRADRARRSFKEAASLYGELYIDLHAGSIAFNQGLLEEAKNHYERMKLTQRKVFREDEGAQLACDVALAEIWLLQGHFRALDKTLPTLARRLTKLEAWRDLYANAVSTAVDYMLARGQFAELQLFLREVHHYLREEQLTDLFPLLSRLEYLCSVALNTEPTSPSFDDEVFPDADTILASLSIWGWRDIESITKAHYQLQQLAGTPLASSHLAEKVVENFIAKGLCVPAARLLITAACSEWAIGRKQEAARLLGQAIELLKQINASGLISLHGDLLRDILKSDLASPLPSSAVRWVENILEIEEDKTEKPMFSPREKDVLLRLIEGKQDKVIARELGVTEHAVRYHLKNIYTRLHVSSRHQAVAHIRNLELLPQYLK